MTREDALSAKPKRLVDASPREESNGGATLTIPLPQLRARWASWLLRVPHGATKTFELDAIGLFVWQSCDGQTSVRHIVQNLARRYNLNLREAEVPTVQFLQTLMRKGLVGIDVK
jgi:hypothetical protein